MPATLNMHFAAALLAGGWATNVRAEIVQGRFARIERNVTARAGDERVAAVLPGICNVHSHGFQRGMAGLTEYRGPAADNFWSWRELMYRFVARMTPQDIEAITAQAYVEMLESGFTRVAEFHYVHHDPAGRPYANPAETAERVAAAARAAGIGLSLLPVFYAHGGFGGAAPNQGQRRFIHDVEGFGRLLERCRAFLAPGDVLGIAPHSLRAVTPQELAALVGLAGAGPVHIHAAEQVREVEECVAWSGQRPVQWLLEHAPVDSRWCLVHSTHMTEDESAALARSGAVAGWCPVTEANLGDGISPAAAYVRAGGRWGIGTDSNVSVSAREELRLLEYSQRLRDRARNVVAAEAQTSTGRALLEAAVAGGARALGLGEVSGIVEGAAADFFSLDVDAPTLACRAGDALIDSFVFGGGALIDAVWSGGVRVVSQGRHHAREAIAVEYRKSLERLL